MKILFLLLASFSMSCLAQNKEDHRKLTNEQLIKRLNEKDKEYEKLKDAQEKLNAGKGAPQNFCADSLNALVMARRQILELKSIIKDNNNVSLRDVFESKYTPKYFQETDLEVEDKTIKFTNSNTLISSVRVDADQKTLELSVKAFDFNKNYLTLFEVRRTVLNVKYDEDKVRAALGQIDSLPALTAGSNLYNTKVKIINLLKNYNENTCLLKKGLDKLKLMLDQKTLNPTYLKYEKEPRFKDYPYLVTVISKMKKDVNSYTPDALQLCEESKK